MFHFRQLSSKKEKTDCIFVCLKRIYMSVHLLKWAIMACVCVRVHTRVCVLKRGFLHLIFPLRIVISYLSETGFFKTLSFYSFHFVPFPILSLGDLWISANQKLLCVHSKNIQSRYILSSKRKKKSKEKLLNGNYFA